MASDLAPPVPAVLGELSYRSPFRLTGFGWQPRPAKDRLRTSLGLASDYFIPVRVTSGTRKA
jgi:hypothetical protein